MPACGSILMIQPVQFGFNAETAFDNAFQMESGEIQNAQDNALIEFNNLVELLRSKNVDVLVVPDTLESHTPDSIFPNNWITFHEDGTIALYPMCALNRRAERKLHVMEEIQKQFKCTSTVDFTHFELEDKFLEGTGSLILDRERKIAYACLSARTHEEVIAAFCKEMGFSASVTFEALDEQNIPIYHTNVLMCVAEKFAVVCLEAIRNETEKNAVCSSLTSSGKEIIEITMEQLNNFAGNMLEVKNSHGEKFLVMSSRAFASLFSQQINKLQSYGNIIHSDLTTIEKLGGGSARCMMAEIYLPKK